MQCDIAGVWIPRLLKLFTCVPSKVQQEQNKPSTHKVNKKIGLWSPQLHTKGESERDPGDEAGSMGGGEGEGVMVRRVVEETKSGVLNAVVSNVYFHGCCYFSKVFICGCASLRLDSCKRIMLLLIVCHSC